MKRLFKFMGILGFGNDNSTSSSKSHIPGTVIYDAIERVVDGIEPNMRFVSGYKKILYDVVATSLSYINDVVDNIPGPLNINSAAFSTDPQVNAYFATVTDIQYIFSHSDELRHFFDEPLNTNFDEAYALMCMNETEKTVFGMELHDDVVQRDVLQTTVNFSEHKILSPAASEADVRKGVKQCIFDGLITHALQQILDLKQQKQELETQRCALNSRLKTRQSEGGGLSNLLAIASELNVSEDIQQQITETEQKLKQLPARWDTARYYLEMTKDVLAHPENFISINVKSFNITKMGIVAGNDSTLPSNVVRFDEILIANVLKRVVAIVRYPRSEMSPKPVFSLK